MVKLGIVAWYQVNKTYVATVLCENKDKPQMNCCGKCYVRKQLNKADDNAGGEKQMPAKNVKAENIDYIMPVVAVHSNNTNNTAAIKVFNGHYTAGKSYQVISSVFHPPQAC
jgi:hypothetical protein